VSRIQEGKASKAIEEKLKILIFIIKALIKMG
jgi:hypothetical protein